MLFTVHVCACVYVYVAAYFRDQSCIFILYGVMCTIFGFSTICAHSPIPDLYTLMNNIFIIIIIERNGPTKDGITIKNDEFEIFVVRVCLFAYAE